jgi:hypothetical protein
MKAVLVIIAVLFLWFVAPWCSVRGKILPCRLLGVVSSSGGKVNATHKLSPASPNCSGRAVSADDASGTGRLVRPDEKIYWRRKFGNF